MSSSTFNDLAVFSGRAHVGLASSICAHLEMPLGAADIFEFSNENIFVRIQENVRSRDVFLIQPLCSPVNTSIMELLIMIDAFRRASAGRITAVIPYYAYGRSDKKDQPRVPITARAGQPARDRAAASHHGPAESRPGLLRGR
jgi:ribose-phosphate pyrophosphokinase